MKPRRNHQDYFEGIKRIVCAFYRKFMGFTEYDDLESIAHLTFYECDSNYDPDRRNRSGKTVTFEQYVFSTIRIRFLEYIGGDILRRGRNLNLDHIFNRKLPVKFHPEDISDLSDQVRGDSFEPILTERLHLEKARESLSGMAEKALDILLRKEEEILAHGNGKKRPRRISQMLLRRYLVEVEGWQWYTAKKTVNELRKFVREVL